MRLEMFAAAENLEFEKAARLRDELKKFQALAGGDAAAPAGGEPAFDPYAASKKTQAWSRHGQGEARRGAQRPALQDALATMPFVKLRLSCAFDGTLTPP